MLTLISKNGFLPAVDPLKRLPGPYFDPVEEIVANLPRLLITRKLRKELERLPILNVTKLRGRERDRGMLLYSFLEHGDAWQNWEHEAPTYIHASVARPLYELSKMLGRPPVLSYDSYAQHNFGRLDPDGPIEFKNLEMLVHFVDDPNETGFVMPHVEIEAEAAAALHAFPRAQKVLQSDDRDTLAGYFRVIAGSLEQMCNTLAKLPEHCSPAIYYLVVRPWLRGFSENPVVFEGVRRFCYLLQYKNKEKGETGAQSGAIPVMNAGLGIVHPKDELTHHTIAMRRYMPPRHRLFLQKIEQGPSIRAYLLRTTRKGSELRDSYNECVNGVARFLKIHLDFALTFIARQEQVSEHNPTTIGTGGTPYIQYLTDHWKNTLAHKI